jgi:hypothetical protein
MGYLVFTRDTLRAAYAFLNETPPFSRWNLPDADDVDFKVARTATHFGWYTVNGNNHLIAVSCAPVRDTQTLLATMAHEMIHVHERQAGACRSGVQHGAAFRRWAAQVCRIHGFDPKDF